MPGLNDQYEAPYHCPKCQYVVDKMHYACLIMDGELCPNCQKTKVCDFKAGAPKANLDELNAFRKKIEEAQAAISDIEGRI